MTKRAPILAVSIIAAVFVLGAAAPFLQVEIYQSGYGLRGPSTNLFSANSNNLNRSIDHSSRQPSSAALSNLAANPNLYQATNAQLTIDANNTGGAATNFRAGDGAFKAISTNWITGLVSDIANILASIGTKQPAAAALTNLANNPSLYQATNAQLTVDANNTGGAVTNFRAGDGTFKPVQTNWVTGLVSDIANILSSIAGKQPAAAALTNLANNPNLYQATNANLTTLAGGNGSTITTGIPGSAITTGTIDTNRLPASLVLSDRAQTFTSPQTFLSTATFGGMTLSNWFGSPMSVRDWEMNRCTFNGSSVPTSMVAGGLTQQNVNGGGWSPTTSTTPGHPGVAYPFSAADNRAGGTGSFAHWNFNSLIGLNPDAISVAVWQPYNTNGVMHRNGWDGSLTLSDPTDAARWIATNGLLVSQTISNSIKLNGSTSIQLNGTRWYTTIIYHTNASPGAAFYCYTNGVLQSYEYVTNFPLGRAVGWVAGALGVASPATNSSVALMLVDDVAYGVSVQGYR